jgi:hypothetical protein
MRSSVGWTHLHWRKPTASWFLPPGRLAPAAVVDRGSCGSPPLHGAVNGGAVDAVLNANYFLS